MSEAALPAVDLEPDAIVRDARAATGLQHFASDWYRAPLEHMCTSLAEESRLNPLGRILMRQRLVDILSCQLQVEDFCRRYPEIRAEKISSPLFIIGLPRTGTTMLHRTIAADPRMFAPLWYEVRYPAPDADWDFRSPDPRIARATAEMDQMLAASPELTASHPMDPVGPDECIMLLEQSFYSYNTEALARLPGFGAWIEQQDHGPGYEYFKLLVQFLQWQKKRNDQCAERWTLKAPHHLHFLDLVFKVFPDARVVQTHRDPVQTIPSLISLIYGCWKIYSDDTDPVECGALWARKFAEGTRRSLQVRERLGEERFLDLWFEDTVSQPLEEIRRIYDFIGMDLTAEATREMRAWQEFNRRELRPEHHYTLEQFGFTEAGLRAQFREYRERFISSRN